MVCVQEHIYSRQIRKRESVENSKKTIEAKKVDREEEAKEYEFRPKGFH